MMNAPSSLGSRFRTSIACLIVIGLWACSAPDTFVRGTTGTERGWATVVLRPGIEPDTAWGAVTDVLAKRFELEMISRDGGYVRTGWIHEWWKVGEYTENYRVRAIAKFSPDWTTVDIRTDANYLDGGKWVVGYDTRLLETVKTDIMGVVGRTTK